MDFPRLSIHRKPGLHGEEQSCFWRKCFHFCIVNLASFDSCGPHILRPGLKPLFLAILKSSYNTHFSSGVLQLFNLPRCLLSQGVKQLIVTPLSPPLWWSLHIGGFITKPLHLRWKERRPQESKWLDGDNSNGRGPGAKLSFPLCWL